MAFFLRVRRENPGVVLPPAGGVVERHDASPANSLLHDLCSLGPGPQSLLHVPVSVVEAGQVHVGVDVLVVVVPLSRADGLREAAQ